jgi:transcriptional regulator with XRE-family HTH domain
MRARVRGMTLQTLLQQHGITRIKELRDRTGLSRQQSWNLWHGRVGVGKATAKRLHERLGLPFEELMQIDPVPAVKRPHTTPPRPRGRPRKTSPSDEPRGDRFGWEAGAIGDHPVNPEAEDKP